MKHFSTKKLLFLVTDNPNTLWELEGKQSEQVLSKVVACFTFFLHIDSYL